VGFTKHFLEAVMTYKKLGRSGMMVSRICLGTMNWGPFTPEKEAFAIMDRALEAGVNYFDTANGYGSAGTTGHKGQAEEIIGRWLKQGNKRREKIILASKVYENMETEEDGPNNFQGLSAYKIRRHIEASLKRLQTDHLEVYQMHHVDRSVTWDELWEVFEILVRDGKTFHIGSSNHAGWQLVKAQNAAKERHFFGLVSEQHKYNLMGRLPELEVLPAAMDLGIAVNVWSPLAGGMLNGHALNPEQGSRGSGRDKQGNFVYASALAEKFRSQFEAYSNFCKEIGENEAVAALAWCLSHPAVCSVIIGPRTLAQFENSLRAAEITLSEEALKKLDEIFPGQGRGGKGMPAPEAYAW
jgi:aryl-alcohol dehydrogenase-like predicted oxidoreductase